MKTVAATMTILMLLISPVELSAADGPPALSHNPFSRPPSEAIPVAREVRDDDSNAPETVPLQATMVGRANSLANIGGRILKPGDDYRGYRLVAIHEDSAVFERGGQSVTIYVKPPETEDRAERRSRNSERQR